MKTPNDNRTDLINVLNLGAGVQSSTVLLMSIHGQLPQLHHAIFADTQWESQAVYAHLAYLVELAHAAGIQTHRVTHGDIRADALQNQVRGKAEDGTRWESMPYFTLDQNGKKGMIRRQCTAEYKIKPIEKCLRRTVLGLRPRQHAPKEPVIRQWFGISSDEPDRMRISRNKWSVYWYPLWEARMTRQACYAWLDANGYPEPPRSACIACPYHTNAEWRHIRENHPDEWQQAIEFDEAIRNSGAIRGQAFLHPDRVPLKEAKIDRNYDPNQLPLFSLRDECGGMCGV